jgi:RNA polymerase sigma factor (sigma-70 family)
MAMTKPEPRQRAGTQADAASVDWPRLLAEHDRWLRTVVAVRLGEPQAIDEVMQEVALAAIRQHAPLADRDKAAPWLYRLAVRQTLLYRRKHGRQRKLVERVALRNQPSEGDNRDPDPLGWLLAKERRGQVREAVSRLGRHDAEILMLKYIEEWSYRELAEHLGVSESAVEARLHRARQRLRAELTALNLVGTEG